MQKNVGFWYVNSKKNNKKWNWNIWIIYLIFFVIWVVFLWFKYAPKDLLFEEEKVVILKWDTIAKFYSKMEDNQVFWMKWYIKRHPDALPKIQEWTYILNWIYTKEEFLSHIAKWPEKEYLSYTILEWWSIYDIDADLTKKWYIKAGEYIEYAKNPSKISELSTRYDFFDSTISSLEGFLYPETYYLSNWNNLVKELVSMQLNTFKARIREPYHSDFDNIKNKYGLSVYDTIKLASIVEKEEKNNANKSTVAWIFYNRLMDWWNLWADITLCYWLFQPYSACTSTVINKNINDKNNRYNTRMISWLTPTPIWNPSESTIRAVLFPNVTRYYFYLHGGDGVIHYAETNAQHEANKKYL